MHKRVVVVGSVNQDLVVSADRIPRPGETVTGSDFQYFAGGKGANQAVAAARLGASVSMIAKLGDDAFGAALRQGLEREGIDTSASKSVPGCSGIAAIARDPTGENTIVVVAGANGKLTPVDLEENLNLIRDAGIVLCQLEVPLETVEYLAVLTERFGVPMMLDPAPARALRPDLLRRIQWITPNETELWSLLALPEREIPEAALPDAAAQLSQHGAHNVIIKLGARGCFLALADGRREFVPAFRVHAVDTTAAGDVFNGAFAACLLEGKDPVASAVFASAAAAISVTRVGAQASVPTRAETQRFLTAQSTASLNATTVARD
ncbi:MAG: ribokinase [Terriglobales bacterium]